MARRVAFNGKNDISVEDISLPSTIDSDQVRIAGICSLMSTGTENIVLNRLFRSSTHWDKWVKYPFYPGYSYLGEIIEVGAEVTHLPIGQRVVLRAGHATEHVVAASRCIAVPDSVENFDAVWFALAKIAYTGAHAANHTLGDKVLVIGGGPIGQLSARWALASGAKVGVVVTSPLRQMLAKEGGTHFVFSGPIDKVGDLIQEAFDSKPDIVIDATGVASVFQHALAICKNHGKVVLLGDTGFPEHQHLIPDVIGRGIQIVGAHDAHHANELPTKLFWDLLIDGRISMRKMNTHQFSIDQAREAYHLANTDRGNTMGMLFLYH